MYSDSVQKAKMKIPDYTVLMLTFSVPWCFGQQAEAGPSKEETVAFLKSKLEGASVTSTYAAGKGIFSVSHTFKNAVVAVECDCLLTLSEKTRNITLAFNGNTEVKPSVDSTTLCDN